MMSTMNESYEVFANNNLQTISTDKRNPQLIASGKQTVSSKTPNRKIVANRNSTASTKPGKITT